MKLLLPPLEVSLAGSGCKLWLDNLTFKILDSRFLVT